MVDFSCLDGSKNPFNVFRIGRYKKAFYKEHPSYFKPDGLLMFCGAQGTGKTLSAVNYVRELSWIYPNVIICSNVEIEGLNPVCKVVEYDGLHCLTSIENGYDGVIYLIDEIHLEFNSLESKNIPIEVMIEVSQQRKQRKHIVGTSQQFMRLAKPLREQVRNLVLCQNYFGCIQVNKLIDGATIVEKDGKIQMQVRKKSIWFHSPDLYDSYDTYKKMRRYRKEWKGVTDVNNTMYGGS
jgi:hypothetical protein